MPPSPVFERYLVVSIHRLSVLSLTNCFKLNHDTPCFMILHIANLPAPTQYTPTLAKKTSAHQQFYNSTATLTTRLPYSHTSNVTATCQHLNSNWRITTLVPHNNKCTETAKPPHLHFNCNTPKPALRLQHTVTCNKTGTTSSIKNWI